MSIRFSINCLKSIERSIFDIISIQVTKLGPEIPDSLFVYEQHQRQDGHRSVHVGQVLIFSKSLEAGEMMREALAVANGEARVAALRKDGN